MAVECGSQGTSLRVEVRAGRHRMVVDEPERLGGTDAGPDPFDLLMAALGACTAITIADAARERGLPLEGVRVTVSAKTSKLASRPGDPELLIRELRRVIEVDGDLSPEDRAWLAERGGDCAVHRSLVAGIPVRTSVV